MGEAVHIKADPSLVAVLEDVRKRVAKEIKDKYKLESVTIHGTMASAVLASMYSSIKEIKFRIRKTSVNTGILELS